MKKREIFIVCIAISLLNGSIKSGLVSDALSTAGNVVRDAGQGVRNIGEDIAYPRNEPYVRAYPVIAEPVTAEEEIYAQRGNGYYVGPEQVPADFSDITVREDITEAPGMIYENYEQ